MAAELDEARERKWDGLDRAGLLSSLREEAQHTRRLDAELATLRATLVRKDGKLKQVREQARKYMSEQIAKFEKQSGELRQQNSELESKLEALHESRAGTRGGDTAKGGDSVNSSDVAGGSSGTLAES